MNALLPHWPSKLTRRDFLLAATTTTGIMAMSATGMQTSSQAAEPVEKSFIDAHVHVWTPDTDRYPLKKGFLKKNMKPSSFTPEELFAHARPNGVSRIVLIQMSFYGFDNSYMLDMMAKHKGVFSGVAVIDENDDPAKTMRKYHKHGVRGYRIRQGTHAGGEWLNGKGMAAMWRCGAETGQAMCPLCQPDSFQPIGRMCRKFPDTPVVIDHFGRIGIDGAIRKSDLDNLCALAKHKNVHVKTSAFYALGKKKAPYTDLAPMIRRLLDAFGPERLMWASDGPFQVVNGHRYKPSIDLIESGIAELSDGDRQWLLRKTAQKVFFS